MISVIVATLNAAGQVERMLRSFREQTWPHAELIVVDGGSTDGTLDALRGPDSPVDVLIVEPDSGIYSAWNKAVPRAKGQWITFLGADDFLLEPSSLEKAAAFLAQEAEARLVYGRVVRFHRDGRPKEELAIPWQLERRRFLQGVMRIPHPGMFHHRALFEERGLFDPEFRLAGDYELLLRELRDRPARYVPELRAIGITEAGVSGRFGNRFAILTEVRRALRRHRRGRFPWALWALWLRSVGHWLLNRVFGDEVGDALVNGTRAVGRRRPGEFTRQTPWHR